MNKEHVERTPIFKDYKSSIVKGCDIGHGCSSRAVIESLQDISWIMPCLVKEIESCVYNTEAKMITFTLENRTVSIEPHCITINDANEALVVNKIMDLLNMLLDHCCTRVSNEEGEVTLIW